MKSFRRLTIFLLVLAMLPGEKSYAQTSDLASQERKIVKLYSKLASFIPGDYDSISLYSNRFSNEFSSFVKNNPGTLNYAFQKLIDSTNCRVQTSVDGNFRIYSWDTWTGGTMHFYKEIYQWKDNGKVFTKIPIREEGDPGSFCSKIFTVHINKQPYYLAVTNGIYSTKDAMESISVYKIDNNNLVDTIELFKTKSKTLNNITVEYDFFSAADRPERPLELITYDHKQKIIYIPVVNDKGQVTTKYILYQLKGHHFEFIGIETGKRI
jgi:hypothetical protein